MPSFRSFVATLACTFALALAAAATAGAAAPAGCREDLSGLVTCTYAYTGAEQTLNLPAGVSTVHLSAVGGAGATTSGNFPIGAGGAGATVSADVPVTGGQSLYIEVGGAGANGNKVNGGPGGFNGGGDGGNRGNTDTAGGGGGGGASDIRAVACGTSCPGDSTSLASRLLVAAGGGGGAYSGAGGDAGSAGADGNYVAAPGAAPNPGGGKPGTASSGGAGGTAGCQNPPYNENAPGADGAAGQGGAGAGVNHFSATSGGGGGGGGYFGGGGGADASPYYQCSGAGGGGGSDYTVTASSNVNTGLAAAGTPTSVTITFSAPAAINQTYYVAPGGAANSCASNSPSNPFATIQLALGCAGDGDTILLAPTGGTPYAGVGPITSNVRILAEPGADARSVAVDLSKPDDVSGMLTVASSASVIVRGATLDCTDHVCQGPNVTNAGALTLDGVVVTGAGFASAIINRSTGPVPARLTVLDSAVVNNTDLGFFGAGLAAGISSRVSGAKPEPVLVVANSTIANNTLAGGAGAGGIYTDAAATGAVRLINTTITHNDGGGGGSGGVADFGTMLTPIVADNTVIAGNKGVAIASVGGPDCGGSIVDGSAGHNLIGDYTSCSGMTNNVNGDLITVPNAGLNQLGDNGGPTPTVSLQQQSLAIAAGDTATCTSAPINDTDQTGQQRRTALRGACDIGAFDTAGFAGSIGHQWYVAPGGTAASCAANSSTTPFATIQAAVACASSGDLVEVSASGATPYPGIGTVATNVTIEAAPGADARSVAVDLSKPDNISGVLTVAPGASVIVRGLTLDCTDHVCQGPDVEVNGALKLSADTVTGAGFASAIINRSTGPVPARLTVLDSAVVNNTDLGFFGAGLAAGISSRVSGAKPEPVLVVANSTIANNTLAGGAGAGGIYTDAAATGAVRLINTTITHNDGGGGGSGGVADFGTMLTPIVADNTVIAGNKGVAIASVGGPDCGGSIVDGSAGHNLIGDYTSCSGMTNNVNGDQIGIASPGLGTLANNGGSTDTVALSAGSPAIAAADPATCQDSFIADRDQRGAARHTAARGTCDIGAFDSSGDATAPTITITTPAAAATYTQNQVVDASYSCQDNPGGSGVAFCTGTAANGQPIDTSTTGSHKFVVDATDNAGNTSTSTVTYTVVPTADTTPPTITLTSPTNGAYYLEHQVIAAAYSCQDDSGGSGVKSCTGTVPAGQAINTGKPSSYQFSVTATDNAGNTTTSTVTYRVVSRRDTTAPTITLTSPQAEGRYTQGQVVAASYSCQDNPGGSGMKSCTGTAPSGAPIDTSTLGTHAFTVTATDNAGNTAGKTIHYRVLPGSGALRAAVARSTAMRSTRSSYTITARNQRGRTIYDVLLGVAVPRGARWISIQAPHRVSCRHTGQVLSCRAPGLRPGGTVTVHIVLVTPHHDAPVRVSADLAVPSARR